MNEREKRLDERFQEQDTAKLLSRAEYEATHRILVDRAESMSKSITGVNDRLIPVEARVGYVNITLIISTVAALLGLGAWLHPLLR